MSEYGRRIKEMRIKKGLSQEELAELSKVNLRTIQRIENNETSPRGKTLKLVYEVLELEPIESSKTTINKYMIWASVLTLLIVAGSFLSWIRRFKMYLDGEKIYTSFTGWEGYTLMNDYLFYNWILSISSIALGAVVICHSIGLIKNKFKHIIVQVIILILYVYGVIYWSHIQAIELRPGLIITALASILLVKAYIKKNRKTGVYVQE